MKQTRKSWVFIKPGDKINVEVKHTKRPIFSGNPCEVTSVTYARIVAVDNDGTERKFDHKYFTIEKVS